MLKVHKAFTIVELMIVVIVIGILASIVIVGYKNATKDSNMSAIKSDLQAAHTSVKRYLNEENRLPTSLSEAGLADTPAAVLGYMYSGDNFCISAVAKSGGFQMHIVRDGAVSDGLCPPVGSSSEP